MLLHYVAVHTERSVKGQLDRGELRGVETGTALGQGCCLFKLHSQCLKAVVFSTYTASTLRLLSVQLTQPVNLAAVCSNYTANILRLLSVQLTQPVHLAAVCSNYTANILSLLSVQLTQPIP